jgi:hypothetical protein
MGGPYVRTKGLICVLALKCIGRFALRCLICIFVDSFAIMAVPQCRVRTRPRQVRRGIEVLTHLLQTQRVRSQKVDQYVPLQAFDQPYFQRMISTFELIRLIYVLDLGNMLDRFVIGRIIAVSISAVSSKRLLSEDASFQ